jgi:Protein of unknown function (DUF1189).
MSYFSWRTPFFAFYSRPLYQHVARGWRGSGLGYLFLVTACCSLLITVRAASILDDFFSRQLMPVLNQLPTLSIKEGTLQPLATRPLVILAPGSQQPGLIIDTSTQPKLDELSPQVWLLQHQARVRQPDGNYQVVDFSSMGDLELDKPALMAFADKLRSIVKVLSFVPIQLSEFVYRLMQALLYSLAGLAYCRVLKVSLGYQALLRLTCVAMTPALLISTLLFFMGIQLPVLGVLYFVASQAYLYFAIQSVGATAHSGDGYIEV